MEMCEDAPTSPSKVAQQQFVLSGSCTHPIRNQPLRCVLCAKRCSWFYFMPCKSSKLQYASRLLTLDSRGGLKNKRLLMFRVRYIRVWYFLYSFHLPTPSGTTFDAFFLRMLVNICLATHNAHVAWFAPYSWKVANSVVEAIPKHARAGPRVRCSIRQMSLPNNWDSRRAGCFQFLSLSCKTRQVEEDALTQLAHR